MLKKHAAIFRKTMILTDLSIVAGSFFLAYYVRNLSEVLQPLQSYLWLLPVFAVLWGFFLHISGMYASFRIKKTTEVLFAIYQAAYLTFFIFAGMCYALRIAHISRIFVLLSFVFAVLFLVVEKVIVIQVFRHLRREGYNYRRVLIVGTKDRAQQLIEKLESNRELGLVVSGVVSCNDTPRVGEVIKGHTVIGSLGDIPKILFENVIDQVMFVVPVLYLEKIQESLEYCETMGIEASVAIDYFKLKISKIESSELLGVSFLNFQSAPNNPGPLIIKRIFSIIFSSIALIILSPVFLIVALLIKATSKGPVFFTQERVGLNGRKFKLYKFRTMVRDAESKLEELRKQSIIMNGPVFKLENDPRLTRVGRFLRKSSIDEFPQFWNIFAGDISLVGPRPPLPQEVKQYDYWQRRRLSMRPGLTGLWQVSGRNKIIDFNEWMKLDLKYIDNWSLWLDIKIIFKTIPTVLFGVGAK